MQDVRVDNSVLARWLTDPHLDNISCLESSVKDYTKARHARLLTTVTK